MQLLHDADDHVPPVHNRRRGPLGIVHGALTVAGGAIGLWLVDVAMRLPDRGHVGTGRWLTGIGAALLVSVTTALVVGGLVGPVSMLLASSLAQRLRTTARRFGDPDPDAQRRLSASALAAVILVVLTSIGANRCALMAVTDFARPESMAVVVAGAYVGALALLLAFWPVVVDMAHEVLTWFGRVPGLRWWTASAPRLLGAIAMGGAVVTEFLLRARWPEIRMLPWHMVLPVPGLIVGLVVASHIGRSSSTALRRATWALITACIALGAVAGLRLRPSSTDARRIAFERTLSGALGWRAWTAILDFDHDGQINVLGGGDCGPFDARIHVGAIDIPGDRIDQDCDGVDASAEVFRPRVRQMRRRDLVATRPDIILITVDGLAANRLVAIGQGPTVMPNVDRFAASSALFVHAFSEGPSTRLSFPSMFTSHYDSELSFTFASRPPYPLAPQEKQIQDLLDVAGYETMAVVSNQYFTPTTWPSVTRGFQRVDIDALTVAKNNSREVTDAALRELNAPHDRPIYLWVHYYDAHSPYVAPRDFPAADHSDAAVYDAELRLVDREAGRLLDAIAARSNPTYVVMTADHGTVFHPRPWTRQGRYGYDLYTATLHVPLMIHGPGVRPRRIQGLASTLDLAPTIADIVGGINQTDFRGVSLVPEAFTGTNDGSRMLFSEFYLGERDYRGEDPLAMVSLRTGQWNIVLDRVHGSFELYDWTRDYFEERDRFADDADLPEIVRFRSLLASFIQQFHRRPPGTAILPAPPVHL